MTMPPDPIPEGVLFTMLLGLKDDVGAIRTDVQEIKVRTEPVSDHEQRLRKLEASRWPLPTVASGAAVAAAVAAWLAYLHR